MFAAIKSKDRRKMHKEIVASQDGVEISFTGEQLNQDDHDNFMPLVKLASGRPLGQAVIVPANAILRTLGRGNGKSQHDQLRADMDRLVTGTVTIRAMASNISGTSSTTRFRTRGSLSKPWSPLNTRSEPAKPPPLGP